jgi:hypothetical protein
MLGVLAASGSGFPPTREGDGETVANRPLRGSGARRKPPARGEKRLDRVEKHLDISTKVEGYSSGWRSSTQNGRLSSRIAQRFIQDGRRSEPKERQTKGGCDKLSSVNWLTQFRPKVDRKLLALNREQKRWRSDMLKTLAGVGVSMLALAAPALAEQPNIVIEFTTLEDTMTVSTLIPGNTISTTELPPHKLATLTLEHAALREHTVQATDMTNPVTVDAHFVSLAVDPQGCCKSAPIQNLPGSTIDIPSILEPSWGCPAGYPDLIWPTNPPCREGYGQKVQSDGYTFNLELNGNRLDGTIDVGCCGTFGVHYACNISMTGSHNHWSGTLDCAALYNSQGVRERHSFTAISRRVDGQANIAER